MKRKIVRLHRPERDRAIFAVLRSLRGMSNAEISAKSGVSAQTIAKWRAPVATGGTKYPQFITLQAVAKACGMEFRLVERNDDARPSAAHYNGTEARA